MKKVRFFSNNKIVTLIRSLTYSFDHLPPNRNSFHLNFYTTDVYIISTAKISAFVKFANCINHGYQMAMYANSIFIIFFSWLFSKSSHHHQIVSPEELSDLFRKEMLTIGLVEVMELYWEWPIQKYADRIGIKQQDIIKIVRLIFPSIVHLSSNSLTNTETTNTRVQNRKREIRKDNQ